MNVILENPSFWLEICFLFVILMGVFGIRHYLRDRMKRKDEQKGKEL